MLTLNEKNDYFTLIHTADALARMSDISAVWLVYMAPEGLPFSKFCTVSDTSVAQFVNTKEENNYLNGATVGDVNENGEYVLRALAPGKVTVTYYIYEAYGGPYTAETEITVLEKEDSSSSDICISDNSSNAGSKDTPVDESSASDVQTGKSLTDKHQTNNPKTDDALPTAVIVLICVSAAVVLCGRKIK